MSPSRPTVRIRPRSAIADRDLARQAVTDLPGSYAAALRDRGLDLSTLLRAARSAGRPLEPERVLIMPLATMTTPLPRRRG